MDALIPGTLYRVKKSLYGYPRRSLVGVLLDVGTLVVALPSKPKMPRFLIGGQKMFYSYGIALSEYFEKVDEPC